MQGVSGIMVLFFMALALVTLLVLYGAVKLYVRMLRGKVVDRGTDVDFVVGTFQGLVAQLKEKERELEVLRRHAEERAGIMEDYNENILQSVPTGVISLDESDRVVKVNSSAERILGVRASEIIGTPVSEVFRGGLEPRVLGSVERGETPYVAASGRRLWLGFSLSPLLDSEKRPIGRLLIFTDLTELKALQSQAELRKRLSSLGEMAAGIAHELRNSMGVISGYTRLLSGKATPELKGAVEAVSQEVSVMDSIISDFLSFARPREPELAELNLRSLAEECVRNIVGERKDIEVTMGIDEDLVIRADPVLLRQAFANLAQNALQAQRDGGSISFSARQDADSVYITVADEGHGIDEAIRDRIFLPFFTTKEKGTGLGLAMVHRIIESHGGSIELESGSMGTTFRLRLPLRKE